MHQPRIIADEHRGVREHRCHLRQVKLAHQVKRLGQGGQNRGRHAAFLIPRPAQNGNPSAWQGAIRRGET